MAEFANAAMQDAFHRSWASRSNNTGNIKLGISEKQTIIDGKNGCIFPNQQHILSHTRVWKRTTNQLEAEQ